MVMVEPEGPHRRQLAVDEVALLPTQPSQEMELEKMLLVGLARPKSDKFLNPCTVVPINELFRTDSVFSLSCSKYVTKNTFISLTISSILLPHILVISVSLFAFFTLSGCRTLALLPTFKPCRRKSKNWDVLGFMQKDWAVTCCLLSTKCHQH